MQQLIVDIPSQNLFHYENEALIRSYVISTAEKGVGEQYGSWQTPRGWHQIRAKIGAGEPLHTIFVQRRAVGIWTPQMEQDTPGKDWILTRILWLSGLEVGFNRLYDCDTMRRCIYIHGCAESRELGVPGSKGCIRMGNQDIIELFDTISVGTKVFIQT